MNIRFLKLSLASPESIRSWTERILPNGKRVGKILKGDLIDYKNGLPIRDGLSCERIFGPMVSFTCTCGRFKCIETRGIHIVHDTLRSSRLIFPDVSRQSSNFNVKQWGELESPFQTSSNSTRLEMNNLVHPTVSQNTISRPVKEPVYPHRLANGSKSSPKSSKSASVFEKNSNIDASIYKNRFLEKQARLLESSVLQSYRQKKMLRFLSDFYYDYQYIYHLNKNEIIPSFVSIFEEPSNISFIKQWSIATDSYKQQTLWYPFPKWEISKSFNWFYPIGNKQMVGLKIHSSIVQNLLKPLYKLLFQTYVKFWFDLKVDYKNFIYEKHIFLWVPNQKLKTQKAMLNFKAANDSFAKNKRLQSYNSKENSFRPSLKTQELAYDSFSNNFRVNPSFFNKFRIQGLFNKSQKSPIIGRLLPSQVSVVSRRSQSNVSTKVIQKPRNFFGSLIQNKKFRDHKSVSILQYQCLNFSSLPMFLLILKQWPKSFFNKTILSNALPLPKTKSFWWLTTKSQKTPSSWYNVFISQNISCIEFLLNGLKFEGSRQWDLKPPKCQNQGRSLPPAKY